jgi:hypothetical protein
VDVPVAAFQLFEGAWLRNMDGGRRKMENGRRRMENRKWRVEDGRWSGFFLVFSPFYFPLSILPCAGGAEIASFAADGLGGGEDNLLYWKALAAAS